MIIMAMNMNEISVWEIVESLFPLYSSSLSFIFFLSPLFSLILLVHCSGGPYRRGRLVQRRNGADSVAEGACSK